MFIPFRGLVILSIAMLLAGFPVYAGEISKKQMNNLDEQVQEIKAETLNLGVQLRLLEEKLLYPSGTQVALFVSLDKAAKYRLDSIEIRLDGKAVTEHVYTDREIEALRKGGVQRIFTGNVKAGEHDLHVFMSGQKTGGADFSRDEKFKFSKNEEPKMVEIRLVNSADRIITLRDW